ncbi:alpha/beta hydrolase [Dictyobacter kobayashii]|uniref:Alpha/beta hydrolase n=1 Tax=Dictyobacter kobayashii TaxID=2014872 RepID=A0A402AQZ0_9CHLR|nr:alpha/beta hydrolase [Dictyobacter kobayashii]GCE21511.1 alpha/beta hydrolase [Dictyobacter kobayashii]
MNKSVLPAGSLSFIPYVIKPDFVSGPENEKLRYAAELGRLVVPEKRSDPASNTIELAFIRLKSTAKQPGPPLVFLAGGPGIPGTDGTRYEGFVPWLAALREVGDVIMLDQRGTGLSLPRLDCLERWDLPLDQPGSRAELLRIGRERCRAAAAFWQEQGVDLSGYTTVESADDVEDLRRALGVERINLYGASYGSHLALATIKRHGAHISRAIIALVEGLDHTIKLPGNVQRHLELLNQLVQQDPRLNTRIPDLLTLMQSVLDRLEAQPVTVEVLNQQTDEPVKVCVGKFDLQLITAQGIGTRDFISQLPARYYTMSQGDFSWLAGEVLLSRQAWLDSAMSFVMDCASGLSEERAARIRQEAPNTLLEDCIDLPWPDIADAWGNPDLGPAFRAPFQSEVPALFISGTLDGRTPISNAEEVCAGFANGQHLIVNGGTHSTPQLIHVPGVTRSMIEFLQGQPITTLTASTPFAFAPLP